MIENFNDFLSLFAILFILIATIALFISIQVKSSKDNDDDDFYQEIL